MSSAPHLEACGAGETTLTEAIPEGFREEAALHWALKAV